MIIVADTTPLSELAKIGELDLLPQVYGKIMIPTEVYQEITTGEHPAARLIKSVNWLNICSVIDSEKVSNLQQITQLDLGESAAIILAEELKATLILIDDLEARKVAISRNLSVTGTLVSLLTAKQLGIINYVKPLLDALINQGTHISSQLYQQVLVIAQEL
jgi:uncharacterized protein